MTNEQSGPPSAWRDEFTPWPFYQEAGPEARGEDRVRQLAATKWRLETGGSYRQWETLGPGLVDELVRAARTWLRAAVVTGLVPESRPPLSPHAPGPGEPVDLLPLLLAGGTVTLVYDSGRPMRTNERGRLVDAPIPDLFEAHAHDAVGRVFAVGLHEEDPLAALADLHGPWDPATAPPDGHGGESPF